jgi:hypothetical protein
MVGWLPGLMLLPLQQQLSRPVWTSWLRQPRVFQQQQQQQQQEQ